MAEDFTRYAEHWSTEDHVSFEALCFHRVDDADEPYTELMRAPRVHDKEWAEEIVKRAHAAAKDEIARAAAEYRAGTPYRTDPETGEGIYRSGAEAFAIAVAKLCDGPGRVASLVSAAGPDLDLFECNTMHERGGALNSYYSGPFASGAVWDSFHFFEDPFGPDSSVSFTTYHLTKSGLEYCLWRWPKHVAQLRRTEGTRSFRGRS